MLSGESLEDRFLSIQSLLLKEHGHLDKAWEAGQDAREAAIATPCRPLQRGKTISTHLATTLPPLNSNI